jgi:hypothetical protein
MIDSIDADITGAGERFRASIDDPVVVDGKVAIPRGANDSRIHGEPLTHGDGARAC